MEISRLGDNFDFEIKCQAMENNRNWDYSQNSSNPQDNNEVRNSTKNIPGLNAEDFENEWNLSPKVDDFDEIDYDDTDERDMRTPGL